MSELNPNHPVTSEMREQYHKLVAFLLWKFCLGHYVVTSAELERFAADPRGTNLVVYPTGNELTLRLVSDDDARTLARRAGGLPV